MTDSCTVKLQTESADTDVSATGFWKESFTQRPENIWTIPRWAPIAGLMFSLAASPATADAHMRLVERSRRDSSTAISMPQDTSTIGRPISRAEALQIARRILYRAERERMEIAEFEASQGIQWEDDV